MQKFTGATTSNIEIHREVDVTASRTALVIFLAAAGSCARANVAVEHGRPAPGAGTGETATVEETELEFGGVSYAVRAEPFAGPTGWGLSVRVEAAVTDGEEHAFVFDLPPLEQDPTGLRFGYRVDESGGASRGTEEPPDTAGLDLVAYGPGATFEISRDWPHPGGKGLGAGDVLELDVAVWGVEGPDGERFSPLVARARMYAAHDGSVEVDLEPLEPVVETPPVSRTIKVGPHSVTFVPAFTGKGVVAKAGQGDLYVLEVGGTTVRFKSAELVVDGLHYGRIEEGHDVTIDHGKVLVDGEPARGEPILNAKLIEFYLDPVSEHAVGGYTLIVSPAAKKTSLSSKAGVHTFVVDGREIRIEKGRIYVDGVSHGKIKKKATIKMWFGDLYVGEKKLEPEKEPEPGKGK
jgi:hypothetical protein